jgi:formamidopyrimidine-DNA glycosylase
MPELPDVETFRRYLASTSMQQPIEHVHVEAPDLLEDTTPQGLGRALKGKRFVDTRRHGKYLFAGLDAGTWLLLHFGMTGYLDYARNADESPEHTRLRIDFANGARLAYVAPRKLGRIRMVHDVDGYIEASGLGPDAASLDADAFRALLRGHRGMIKSFLMNQEAIAGLGNVYSDEALYHAGIHPRAKLEDLSDEQIDNLHRAIRRVIDGAIDADVDIFRMPDTWLLPNREEGNRCPRCGGEIRQLHAGGRTAYYCPSCQPEPEPG